MAYFWFAFCVMVWSTSFVLMKKAVLVYEPLGVAAWRVLLGATIVFAAWCLRSRRWTLAWRQACPLAFVTLLGFVWPFSIQPILVGRVGSSVLGMSVGLVPLMTVIVSVPLLRVFPNRRQLAGIIGALLSLTVLMLDRLRLDVPIRDLAMALTVPLGYACSNVVVRRWLREVPALELTALSLVGAALCLSPSLGWTPKPSAKEPAILAQTVEELSSEESALVEAPIRESSPITVLQATMCVVALGVLGTGMAQVFFNRMIQDRGPLFASMANNLVPVGAVVLGWWDSEHVTFAQVIALIGVISMVALVQYEPRWKRIQSP